MIWIFCYSSCWPAGRRRSRGITDNEMPTRWFSKSDTLQSHGNSLGVEVEGSGFKSQLHSSWLCDLEHAFKSVWDFVKWGCYKTIFYKLTLRMKWDNTCGRALENTVLCNISYYLMRHSEELQVETNGWNIPWIFSVSLSPTALSPSQILNPVVPLLHAHIHLLKEIHIKRRPGE